MNTGTTKTNLHINVLFIPGMGHNWENPAFIEEKFIPSLNRTQNPEIHTQHLVWGIKEDPLHFFDNITQYKREADLAGHDTTSSKIEDIITNHQPSIIVTHSLGARALYHAVLKGLKLDTVTDILMLQPDIPVSYDVDAFFKKIDYQDVTSSYSYCPWDDLLGLSSLVENSLKLGQLPVQSTQTNSWFLPLQIKWNQHPHNSPLYDPMVEKFIQEKSLDK